MNEILRTLILLWLFLSKLNYDDNHNDRLFISKKPRGTLSNFAYFLDRYSANFPYTKPTEGDNFAVLDTKFEKLRRRILHQYRLISRLLSQEFSLFLKKHIFMFV